jgi:hypothetical protein
MLAVRMRWRRGSIGPRFGNTCNRNPSVNQKGVAFPCQYASLVLYNDAWAFGRKSKRATSNGAIGTVHHDDLAVDIVRSSTIPCRSGPIRLRYLDMPSIDDPVTDRPRCRQRARKASFAAGLQADGSGDGGPLARFRVPPRPVLLEPVLRLQPRGANDARNCRAASGRAERRAATAPFDARNPRARPCTSPRRPDGGCSRWWDSGPGSQRPAAA